MIITILIVSLAFIWLLIESNCLRVRLPMGGPAIPVYDTDFNLELIPDIIEIESWTIPDYNEFWSEVYTP